MTVHDIQTHLPAQGQRRAHNGLPVLIETLRVRMTLQDMRDFAAIRHVMISLGWTGTDSALLRAILRAAADDILGTPRTS